MQPADPTTVRLADRLVGLAAIAVMVIGIFASLAAIVAFAGDDMGGGDLCLIAAAIAFGSILRTAAP